MQSLNILKMVTKLGVRLASSNTKPNLASSNLESSRENTRSLPSRGSNY